MLSTLSCCREAFQWRQGATEQLSLQCLSFDAIAGLCEWPHCECRMPEWTETNPLRVVTGYHNVARKFFTEKGFEHVVLLSADGALEAAPLMGTADIILDLVSPSASDCAVILATSCNLTTNSATGMAARHEARSSQMAPSAIPQSCIFSKVSVGRALDSSVLMSVTLNESTLQQSSWCHCAFLGEHGRDAAGEQSEGDSGRPHHGQRGSTCCQCCSAEGESWVANCRARAD